jgi:Ran GTPase-activating protein (RanGAP) involved in mRNA processing and transport
MSFGRLTDYRSPEELGRMTDHAWMILLNELLARQDAEAFLTICDLFSVWPTGPERSRHLARTVQAMKSWGEDIRSVSSAYRKLYDGAQLSDVAVLARSIEIYRREETGGSHLYAIATSEYVGELTKLRIITSDLTARAWTALATSQQLRSLRSLVVHNSTLSQDDIAELLRSRNLPELRTLQLTRMGLEIGELSQAQAARAFPNLETLDLSDNLVRTEGALQLAGAPLLAQLKSLAIRRNFLARNGIEALLGSRLARRLTSIDARENNISADDQRALGELAERNRIELLL